MVGSRCSYLHLFERWKGITGDNMQKERGSCPVLFIYLFIYLHIYICFDEDGVHGIRWISELIYESPTHPTPRPALGATSFLLIGPPPTPDLGAHKSVISFTSKKVLWWLLLDSLYCRDVCIQNSICYLTENLERRSSFLCCLWEGGPAGR